MIRLSVSRLLAVFFLSILATAQAWAAILPGEPGVVHVDDLHTWPVPLNKHILVYEDASRTLDFNAVRRLAAEAGFAPLRHSDGRARFTRSAWWITLTLVNSTDKALHLRLACDTSSIARLDAYQSTGNTWSHLSSGEALPLSAQPFGVFRREAIPLTLAPRGQTTVFVRIQSEKAIKFSPRLYSEKAFAAHDTRLSLWSGTLIGGILALAVGALHVTLFSRGRTFALLALLSLTTALYELSVRGYAKLILWPESTDWAVRATPVFGYLSLSLFLVFVMSGARLLNLKLPGKAWLTGLALSELALAAMALWGDVYTVTRLGLPLIIVHIVVTIAVALMLIKQRTPAARVTFAVTLFFALHTALRFSGEASFFPQWVTALNMSDSATNPIVGLLSLYVNLAFLAAWIVIIAKQRNQAQRDLLAQRRQEKNRLQAEVARQTAALNSALQYANEKNRQKTETLGYIGHDLRAPLATIAGYAQLLNKENKPSQAPYIRAIERSAHYQLTLIDELLDYAKNELQPLELHLAPVSLASLLDDVAYHMTALCMQRTNTFTCQTTGPIPAQVIVDGRRLQQVLLNLVSNAAKFTQRGRISLLLDATRDIDNHWVLTFSVCDSGIGIAADKQASIFSAFTQENAGQGGLGLGLFIAQRIVENMGGHLALESTQGCGSTFSFRILVLAEGDTVQWSPPLPAGVAAADAAAQVATGAEPTAATPLPPAYARMALATFARDGQLSEIENWLADMHEDWPDCAPFLHRIHTLLDTLDLEEIESLALAPEPPHDTPGRDADSPSAPGINSDRYTSPG